MMGDVVRWDKGGVCKKGVKSPGETSYLVQVEFFLFQYGC